MCQYLVFLFDKNLCIQSIFFHWAKDIIQCDGTASQIRNFGICSESVEIFTLGAGCVRDETFHTLHTRKIKNGENKDEARKL